MSGAESPELELLEAGHAPAVLAFEVANRAWFTASVPDRGDDYFTHFAQRHHALLAEQESGRCAFYVLVADDGVVLGRFNLIDIDDGVATLGYRVAQQVAGRGVATATVQQLCRLATTRHGLHTINASVTRTTPHPAGCWSRPDSSRSDRRIRPTSTENPASATSGANSGTDSGTAAGDGPADLPDARRRHPYR